MEDVRAELSPESYARLIRMAKYAGPIVKRNTQRRLKDAAEVGAEAAKAAILGAPVTGGKTWRPMVVYTGSRERQRLVHGATKQKTYLRHSGLRAGIAAGVDVSVRAESVRITSSNKGLRADQYRMNRTYDKPEFRHPVFGHGSAAQAGLEWFYEPIRKTQPVMERNMIIAMEESNTEIAGL